MLVLEFKVYGKAVQRTAIDEAILTGQFIRNKCLRYWIDINLRANVEPTGKAVGLDLGRKYFIALSNGETEPAPQFYRQSEVQLNRANRKKSKKYRKGTKPQSKN